MELKKEEELLPQMSRKPASRRYFLLSPIVHEVNPHSRYADTDVRVEQGSKKTGKAICVLRDARSACVFCVFFLITLIMKMGALSSYELIDQYSRCEDKLMK